MKINIAKSEGRRRKRRRRLKFLYLIVVAVITAGLLHWFFTSASVKAELVCDFNKYAPFENWQDLVYASHDSSNTPAVVCTNANGKSAIFWNGMEIVEDGGVYWENVRASDDNKYLAYVVSEKDVEGKHFRYVEWNGTNRSEVQIDDKAEHYVWSYSGSASVLCCYVERENKRRPRLYYMGTFSDEYDEIRYGSFGLSGRRIAYIARNGNKEFVVCDGIAGKEYQAIVDCPIFSPDGKHLVYSVRRDGKTCIVLDDSELDITGEARSPTFAPDGRLACIVIRDGMERVWIDATQSSSYDKIESKIWFNRDGRRVAYVALNQATKKRFLVVDGRSGPEYWEIKDFEFDSAGEHYTYLATGGDGKKYFVRDEKAVDVPFETRYCLSSPDGKRLACRIYDGATRDIAIVLDGVEVASAREHCDEFTLGCMSFSPDSKHFAYVKRMQLNTVQKWINKIKYIFPLRDYCVVVDGKSSPGYYFITTPKFESDGKLVYYAIGDRKDLKLYRMTIDP